MNILLFLLLLIFNSSTFASIITSEVITGSNNKINIIESTDSEDIVYTVDILDENSSLSISAFAVSTNSLNAYPSTNRNRWGSYQLNQEMWDSGFLLSAGDSFFNTTSLGNYSSFFDDDLFVLFYYQFPTYVEPPPCVFCFTLTGLNDPIIDGTPITIDDDENYNFYESPEFHLVKNTGSTFTLTSEFIAFDSNGLILDKSFVVPEPTSIALLGLGLAGFGFSKKKKKI